MKAGPRDRELIDALEALPVEEFQGTVWRVTGESRDPTIFRAGGNRWDDGSFEVLYTSLDREGALAEIWFHLSRGQPVVPSKLRYVLHELEVRVPGVVDLTDWSLLGRFGVHKESYGRLPYVERESEYSACQKIAEAIHFLGSDSPNEPSGLLVPNARRKSINLVIFGDYVSPDDIHHIRDHGIVDWGSIQLQDR